MDHPARLAKLRSLLPQAGVDALLVTELTNVRYLTGFSGTNGQVLVTATTAVFFSDPRYEARAHDLVEGAGVVIYPSRLTDVLGRHLAAGGIETLGVEGSMTLTEHDDLAGRVDRRLETTKGLVEQLRRIKEPAEVEAISAAIAIGDQTFTWVLGMLAPGISEREVSLAVEIHMRELGAEEVSFPPIVGSGPLSAHIHHSPSDRRLEPGDLVLLDFGCRLDGYCSDLSRTVVLGSATDEQLERYRLVAEAQEAGIAAVGAGRTGVEVDAAARDVISGAGLGERFGHGLGHGVGLDIHEAPRLHRISEDTLEPGDVITVEPGVYVPGDGGVRIEDCVLVTADGAEVLGSAPKDRLMEL